MSDLLQQAQTQAPGVTIGGIITLIVSFFTHSKLFAKPQDIELAIAKAMQEIGKVYLAKEDLDPIRDDLRQIKELLYQMAKK